MLLRIALLLALSLPRMAAAALGADASSVEQDRVQMHSELRATPHALYTVQQLQTGSGTTVAEFLTPSGRVFAVAWRGPTLPDLRQLLGASFETYRSAPRTPGSGRSYATVALPELVVHSSGHPRSFTGLAYLPQWLPAGVTVGELQAVAPAQ